MCFSSKASKQDDTKSSINNPEKEQLSRQALIASKKLLDQQTSHSMLGVSLVIARNNQGKFLAVKENYNQGWWIPGGLVDPPEDFLTAAIRETKEEAGIDIEIKGILRIEHSIKKNARYKVVFYGEPKDQNQIPKQIPDEETQEARWVTLPELEELGKQPPYLRGKELLNFGSYLQKGGVIYPLDIIETVLVQQFVYKPLQNVQMIPQINQKQIENTCQINQQMDIEEPNTVQKVLQKEQQTFNISMDKAPASKLLGLSLIVIRNKQNKYLAVKESRNRGWWLPGGRVDPPEDFVTAAIREAKEEAGLDISVKGILRIEQNYQRSYFRYKVVFYAEPLDDNQKPKDFSDNESEEARWVTLDELQQLASEPPYLRGTELQEYGEYLEKGGPIYPIDIINSINI